VRSVSTVTTPRRAPSASCPSGVCPVHSPSSSAAAIYMAPNSSPPTSRFSALGKLYEQHYKVGKCGSIGLRFSLFSQAPTRPTTNCTPACWPSKVCLTAFNMSNVAAVQDSPAISPSTAATLSVRPVSCAHLVDMSIRLSKRVHRAIMACGADI
jgi:hypothetical protein